jgi:periplasmic divalent cation tolerance protein
VVSADGPDAQVVLVTVSVPDVDTGERLADELVERRLAACVKQSGPVRSVYRWQGRVECAQEWLLSCVTTAERVEALSAAVRELHPHEVPEVVATAVVAGDADYLRWVRAESTG